MNYARSYYLYIHFIKESSLKNNRKPLKIYLGDLTYDTVTISAESIPLNIGFVAAYCKKQFGKNFIPLPLPLPGVLIRRLFGNNEGI